MALLSSDNPYSPAGASQASRRVAITAWQMALVLVAAYHVYLVASGYHANKFYTHDVAHDNYTLYYTWHGEFFYSIVHDCPHFSKHFTPTHILLVPFHALVRHVLLLPILETLAVMLGAWAVAWMFRAAVSRRRGALGPLALAAGWLYLASPLTGSLALANHFESFAVALGLAALAALLNGRNRLFWVLFLLTLGCKEDIPIYWAPFGLWWLWRGGSLGKTGLSRLPFLHRSHVRTGAAIFAVSVLWFGLAQVGIRWTAAHFEQPLFEYAPRYAWLGDSLGERLATIFGQFRMFTLPLLQSGSILLPPALFLACFAPTTLLLLVFPAYVMGWSSDDGMNNLYYYYCYPFMPFLYLGTALGLARLTRWTRRLGRHRHFARASITLLLTAAGIWLICAPTRTDHKYRLPDQGTARHTFIRLALREMIPPDASVCAQYDLLCQLPMRIGALPLSEGNIERAEYIALDFQGFRGDVKKESYQRILYQMERWVEEGRATQVLFQNGLLIVRRTQGETTD